MFQFPGFLHDLGHPRREGLVGDQRGHVGVVVQVLQLTGHIVEVHIDRHGAQFVGREHGLDILGAVAKLQADMIVPAQAQARPVVRQARGAIVQFPVAQAPLLADHGDTVGNRIRHGFEQVGQVVAHAAPFLLAARLPRLRGFAMALLSAFQPASTPSMNRSGCLTVAPSQ